MVAASRPVIVPSHHQFAVLQQFADLARARRDLVRLYGLLPTPSLDARLRAVDHVLVKQYECLIYDGLGLEGAAILALHRANHVRLAVECRAA